MRDRALSVLAATLAALALAAVPAFAGEDDDGDDDSSSSSQVQNLPAAPAEAPRGGVATGLGGTAPGESDSGGILLGGGLLLTGAGALVAIRRRMT
jgi:LPXTG-motif cell wall-anchored protein